MAARSWQDDLAQQAEEGSARLRELLSVGLGFLRTELGLDLGLEPKRYPGWVILMGTGALGLLLLFLLGYGWAAACAGARKKRRSPPRKREEAAPPTSFPEDPAQLKNLRSEEQKKKNRKKLPYQVPNHLKLPASQGQEVHSGLQIAFYHCMGSLSLCIPTFL